MHDLVLFAGVIAVLTAAAGLTAAVLAVRSATRRARRLARRAARVAVAGRRQAGLLLLDPSARAALPARARVWSTLLATHAAVRRAEQAGAPLGALPAASARLLGEAKACDAALRAGVPGARRQAASLTAAARDVRGAALDGLAASRLAGRTGEPLAPDADAITEAAEAAAAVRAGTAWLRSRPLH